MERRPSASRPQRSAVPRLLRRPIALVRRTLARDGLYIAITLVTLTALLLLIAVLSGGGTAPVVYPSLLSFERPSVHHANSSTGFAVSGSMRDLERLLRRVTNATSPSPPASPSPPPADSLVVAIAVNYAFRNLALNFVCNLKRIAVRNYVVLAMDRAVFDYLAARGANVFHYDSPSRRRLLQEPDAFGTAAFVETSRRKSILVLKVLRLGYSVVFSDVDVVWVKDPIPELLRHDFDFVVQSDRAHKDQDVALNYNLNSGFYLVRSTLRSVTALKAIVKYAEAIRRSEQKAFNYVLCGAFKDHHAGPGTRIGAQECTYRKGGTTVLALPLDAFPNGSDESLWSNKSASFVESHPDVVAVHANYIEGLSEKVDRIKRIGYWLHSEDSNSPDECVLPPKR